MNATYAPHFSTLNCPKMNLAILLTLIAAGVNALYDGSDVVQLGEKVFDKST